MTAPVSTPDGRYIVVRGRLWRATNPNLPADARHRHVHDLMDARRAVASAKRAGDAEALAQARKAVDASKIALGERGPPWWTDGAADDNRRMVSNTAYADWWAGLPDDQRT